MGVGDMSCRGFWERRTEKHCQRTKPGQADCLGKPGSCRTKRGKNRELRGKGRRHSMTLRCESGSPRSPEGGWWVWPCLELAWLLTLSLSSVCERDFCLALISPPGIEFAVGTCTQASPPRTRPSRLKPASHLLYPPAIVVAVAQWAPGLLPRLCR